MNNKPTHTTHVGPLRLDYASAREIGWTDEMIEKAIEQMGDLSRSFTKQVGITCPHCELFIKRPEDGWPCEPKDVTDAPNLALRMQHLLSGITCRTQRETDAKDEVYDLIRKHLK